MASRQRGLLRRVVQLGIGLVLSTGCKSTAPKATTEGLILTPVGLFADIALDLVKYVEDKTVNGTKDKITDFNHRQVDQIFDKVCTFVCEVVTGVDAEETKEVDQQQKDLDLQKDADLKWNLGLEIQSIVNQAKKIVPGSVLAPAEVIDLRKRLSQMEATIASTMSNVSDPATATRALANFNTFLMFIAVGNWVDDLAVDVETAATAPKSRIALYRKAQLDFLRNQQTRLAKYADAADTVLLSTLLKQGSETYGGTVELGVDKSVRYVYWGEFKDVRKYGSPSATICANGYMRDCVTQAEDEAKDNFMREVLPGFQADFRAQALGQRFDSFVKEMGSMTAPVAAQLDAMQKDGVVIAPDSDLDRVEAVRASAPKPVDDPNKPTERNSGKGPTGGDGGGAGKDGTGRR